MYRSQATEQTVGQLESSPRAPEPAAGGVHAMGRQTPAVQRVTVEPQAHETVGQRAPLDERSSRGGLALRWILAGFKRLAALAIALVAIVLAVRPILHLCGFAKLFSHPSIAELSLYVTILGLLTVAF